MANDDVVSVNPSRLRKSGETTNVPAQQVRAALQNFYNSISQLPPEPWGKGEIGEKFIVVYEGRDQPQPAGYKVVLKSLEDMTDGLTNLGDKSIEMADNYIATENLNKT